MKDLIIGYGEIGKAIDKVFGPCDKVDREMWHATVGEPYRIMHVCMPYSEKFNSDVMLYQGTFRARYTVIHSTVPVGTSWKLNAIHSPVRGVHPHLARGIKTFVKYLGGEGAHEVARIFNRRGVKTEILSSSLACEALKIWDTTQYGLMIALNKEIHEWCDKNRLDFSEVYTNANKTYNKGYMKLGRNEVVRPYLKFVEGPIGGHCVMPNIEFLERSWVRDAISKHGK